MLETTKIREDGRLTVPVETRKELDLEPGDSVIIDIRPIEEVADASEN